LLISGNKIYSPDTCVFVSRKINTLLLKGGPKNTKEKVGTSLHRASGKFESYCSNSGKKEYLGLFDSDQEAHQAHCNYKYKLIADIAANQTEPLKSALLNYKISEY